MQPRLRAVVPIPPRVWEALGCYLVPASPAVWSATAPDSLSHDRRHGRPHRRGDDNRRQYRHARIRRRAMEHACRDRHRSHGSEAHPLRHREGDAGRQRSHHDRLACGRGQGCDRDGPRWRKRLGRCRSTHRRPGWRFPPTCACGSGRRCGHGTRPSSTSIIPTFLPSRATQLSRRRHLDSGAGLPHRGHRPAGPPRGGTPATMTANGSYDLDLPIKLAGPASIVPTGTAAARQPGQ